MNAKSPMDETAPRPPIDDRSDAISDRLRSVPAPGRNKDTVEARRASIVDACIEELREHGFHRMKVESVARRAGIDKRTLYDYIQRKEDLLLLVFRHYLPRILHAVREARDQEKEPADQFAAMLRTHTSIVSANPHFVLFLYRELPYLLKEDQTAVLAMINDIHLEYSRTLAALYRNGGGLPSDDAELNASSTLAMIDMIGLYRPHVKNQDPEMIADYIQHTLLRGNTRQ
jgi:AcrR family transcriptional regulator